MFTDLLVPVTAPIFDIASLLRTEGNAALDLHNDCPCDTGCPDCNVLLEFAVSTWALATDYESMSYCDLGVHVNCDDYDPEAYELPDGSNLKYDLEDGRISWSDFDPDGILADPDEEPTPLPDGSRDGYDDLARDVFNVWEPDWMLSERINFRKHLLDLTEGDRP